MRNAEPITNLYFPRSDIYIYTKSPLRIPSHRTLSLSRDITRVNQLISRDKNPLTLNSEEKKLPNTLARYTKRARSLRHFLTVQELSRACAGAHTHIYVVVFSCTGVTSLAPSSRVFIPARTYMYINASTLFLQLARSLDYLPRAD